MALVTDHAISCREAGVFASDLAVVNAARISFDHEHEALDKSDEGLINYLLKNRHGTPFEHGYFKFKVEAPIFVFREHHRHRAGHSYNEMSGRYTELEEKFFFPKKARVRVGKAGAYSYLERAEDDEQTKFMTGRLKYAYEAGWNSYQEMLKDGIAPEQARLSLPVGLFTKMIWSCNPRSLMHFLSLRAAPTAQQEIQTVAYAAETALAKHMPVTHLSFISNGRTAP
jgi:thymidylate synthase (FAD)